MPYGELQATASARPGSSQGNASVVEAVLQASQRLEHVELGHAQQEESAGEHPAASQSRESTGPAPVSVRTERRPGEKARKASSKRISRLSQDVRKFAEDPAGPEGVTQVEERQGREGHERPGTRPRMISQDARQRRAARPGTAGQERKDEKEPETPTAVWPRMVKATSGHSLSMDG